MGEATDPTRVRPGLNRIVDSPVEVDKGAIHAGSLGVLVREQRCFREKLLSFRVQAGYIHLNFVPTD